MSLRKTPNIRSSDFPACFFDSGLIILAVMLWIIALLCLGIVGALGYYQGPIRVACSLLGLIFGSLLAVPLSPLTKKIMPIFGLHHPAWDLFVPALIAFLIVLIAFK